MLAYDIEILKAVPSRNEERDPDIAYCGGWDDHANMGISVICAYDWQAQRYRVFLHDNFHEFQELVGTHQTIVSFNGVQFDDKVCKANGIHVDTSYDILREQWIAAGLSPTWGGGSHAGFGLDASAKANFDLQKTGYGGTAPVEWQREQFGKVIDYCLEDVRLTVKLMDRILDDGKLRDPRNATNFLTLPHYHERPLPYILGEPEGTT